MPKTKKSQKRGGGGGGGGGGGEPRPSKKHLEEEEEEEEEEGEEELDDGEEHLNDDSEEFDDELDDDDDDDDDELDDDDDELDDEEEEEEFDDEPVNVELDFRNVVAQDRIGVASLLRRYLDYDALDATAMFELFLDQPRVGTVVRTVAEGDEKGDDEDMPLPYNADEGPVALAVPLSIQGKKRRLGDVASRALNPIRRYIRAHAPTVDTRTRFEEAWDKDGTFLVVSERLYNAPAELAAPLAQAIFDEVDWAAEDEKDKAKRAEFQAAKRFLIFGRCYEPDNDGDGGDSDDDDDDEDDEDDDASAKRKRKGKGKAKERAPKKKQRKADASAGAGADDSPMSLAERLAFPRAEDYVLTRHASWAFDFAVPPHPDADTASEARRKGPRERRVVALVLRKHVKAARRELEQLLGPNASVPHPA